MKAFTCAVVAAGMLAGCAAQTGSHPDDSRWTINGWATHDNYKKVMAWLMGKSKLELMRYLGTTSLITRVNGLERVEFGVGSPTGYCTTIVMFKNDRAISYTSEGTRCIGLSLDHYQQ